MNTKLLQALWAQFTRYKGWLATQPLSAHTRRAYASRLNHFLVFLATAPHDYGQVVQSQAARDTAVRDYTTHLSRKMRYSAATINSTLSTIDHFYTYLGMQPVDVEREVLEEPPPSVLTAREQKRLVQLVNSSASSRDKSVVMLLMGTGIRVGECAALDVGDLAITRGRASITIRSDWPNRRRTIGLDEVVAKAMKAWLAERAREFADSPDEAVFLNYRGRRITTAGLDLLIRKIGKLADLHLSAEVLRQTCLTSLLAGGKDLASMKDFSGHKRLETTRRYMVSAR